MPTIQNVKYEKRVRPSATDQNPTMTSLMTARDQSDFVTVDIPRETSAFDVAYEGIQLNSYPKFEPGKSYSVPPAIATELYTAIHNFEQSIILQMSKRNKAAKEAGIIAADEVWREENIIPVAG